MFVLTLYAATIVTYKYNGSLECSVLCMIRIYQNALYLTHSYVFKNATSSKFHVVTWWMIQAEATGVNFCKAARLKPPHFSNSKAFRLLTPPPLFATCNAYYEAIFCNVKQKMTPNDIHDNQVTSFIRIQQQKLQGVLV